MAEAFVFRVHAVRRMALRGVTAQEVIAVVRQDERIEDYPDDFPFASRLLLGWINGRPLHVVAAQDEDGPVIIVTVYEPDPTRWDTSFRERINQ